MREVQVQLKELSGRPRERLILRPATEMTTIDFVGQRKTGDIAILSTSERNI